MLGVWSVKTPALPLDDTFPTGLYTKRRVHRCLDARNPSRIEEVCRVVSFSFLGQLTRTPSLGDYGYARREMGVPVLGCRIHFSFLY